MAPEAGFCDPNSAYDVIIIGSGPAGLVASIYASRYRMSNIVIGKQLGGELVLAHKIENYPGFMSISGLDLAQKWQEQVRWFGAKVLAKEIGKIEPYTDTTKARFKVSISDTDCYYGRSIIVATGSERRRLNVPGEKEYLGRGVSYCTTCDAPFFRNKTVALVGGSDSAVSGAVHTADYAKKVYIIYRKEKLRAEPAWQEEWKKIEISGKGETLYNTNIIEILGDGMRVTGLRLDSNYKNMSMLSLDGVFIEIGGVPGTALVKPLGVKFDETGHVEVLDDMSSGVPGLFCAGDMISKSSKFKQAIWAMSQGAMAAASAYRFVRNMDAPALRSA